MIASSNLAGASIIPVDIVHRYFFIIRRFFMTLQQLRYIIAIVKWGSITEAAKQLYIAQPSLSNAVKELENELGIEIFNRTSRGISVSKDGNEFLCYARQVVEQADLLEHHYKNKRAVKKLCSISTQHYSFAVSALVSLIKAVNTDEYEFTLRETRTYEIIEDVRSCFSEVGIIYISSFNEKVMKKILKDNHLVFNHLLSARPHVFISADHPLADRKLIEINELEDYPCLMFEQGTYNSFYFSEEILSNVPHKKTIHVSDRATLFNLLIGLNGYTVSTGIISHDLNDDNIISVPLNTDEDIRVGWIVNEKMSLSAVAKQYISELKKVASEFII